MTVAHAASAAAMAPSSAAGHPRRVVVGALLGVVVVAATACADVIRQPGWCVAYGFSGASDDDRFVNVVANVRAQPVTAGFYDGDADLRTVCPSLANETNLCCDVRQFGQLASQVQQALVILARCNACYRNFREFFVGPPPAVPPPPASSDNCLTTVRSASTRAARTRACSRRCAVCHLVDVAMH